MRAAFMREAMTKKRAPLLLTAAVPAGKLSIDAGYDIPRISRYCFITTYKYFSKIVVANNLNPDQAL